MHHTNEFGAWSKKLLVFVDKKFSRIVDRHNTNLRALLFGQHLPRYDVGMMLERGQNDFVACMDIFAAITVHYEVDRISRSTGKNNLPVFARVDEMLQLAARAL